MHSYKRLPGDPGTSGEPTDNVTSSGTKTMINAARVLLILKDVVLVILTIAAIVAVASWHREPVPDSCNCGSSIAEARSLGCEYDTLASAWLPQHCIDKELTAEFDRSGDGPNGTWQYWADGSYEHELTLDELAGLADVPGAIYYMSTRWHVIHCIFYWRKQIRRQSTGVTLEPRYNHEGHVKHCGIVFQSPKLKTQAGVALNSD
ncbi:hypothetical protein HD806DRAFT_501631 [Xylariaceae sp. AK1471]|nr:hypothetical protein HD806DRAFT_501631 [Xylariaceae sp. AK1471]